MTDDTKEELEEIVKDLEEMIEYYEHQVYALAMEGLIMTALNDAKISLLMQALATIQEITDDTEIHDIAASAINAVKVVQYEPPAKEQIN
jgi:acetolactate synthase small subunit